MEVVFLDLTAAPSEDARRQIRRQAAKCGREQRGLPLVHLDQNEDKENRTTTLKNRHRKHMTRWRYQRNHQPALGAEPCREKRARRCYLGSTTRAFDQIRHLHSPQANRQLIFAQFANDLFPFHFPKAVELWSHHVQWYIPITPSMEAAVDCVYLLRWRPGVGITADGCPEADAKYSLARQLIIKEIQAVGALQSDGLLCAIDLLSSVCAKHDRDSHPSVFGGAFNPLDLLHHFDGVLAIIQARGDSALGSPFARNLIFNTLPMAVMRSLVQRKRSFFAERSWLDALRSYCNTPLRRLMLLGINLPCAMEGIDHPSTFSTGHAEMCLLALYEQINLLEEWKSSWYLSDQPNPRPTEKPVVAFSRLESSFTHYFSPKSGCPFPSFLAFRSDEDAHIHQTYWVLLFFVQQCIAEMAERVPNLQQRYSDQRTTTIDSICKTVAHLCSCDTPGLNRQILADTLGMASEWYAKQGDGAKEKWCQALLAELGGCAELVRHERLLCGMRHYMLLD